MVKILMQMPGWPVNLLIESPAIKYTIIFEKCTQKNRLI